MKFKLINPVNPNYSPTEQILTNRGIPIEEIEHYLNTTDKDINPPEAFGQGALRVAAALLIQTIQLNKQTAVIVDCDCDGYTSSALLINYLHDLYPSYVENNLDYFIHDSKQHGLSDCMDWLLNKNNLGLVICPDSASNDFKEHKQLKDNGINVLILDHHDVKIPKNYSNAVIINNNADYEV